MLSQYEIIRGYPSNSASDTDIWEARDRRTGQLCVFKVFIRKYEMDDGKRKKTVINPHSELMLHEIEMYRYLKEQLIGPKNVRNILCIQNTFEFAREELVAALRNPKLNLSSETIAGNIMRNFKYLVLAVADNMEARKSITANLPFTQKDYLRYEDDLLRRRKIPYRTVRYM